MFNLSSFRKHDNTIAFWQGQSGQHPKGDLVAERIRKAIDGDLCAASIKSPFLGFFRFE